MKILVTGASGFIGSVVARLFCGRGDDVRCLVRSSSLRDRVAHLMAEIVTGDLLDPASLVAATAGCDAVVHLAGISNWIEIQSPRMHDVVFGGTRNLLAAALESHVKRFVYVSSTIAIAGTLEPVIHTENSPDPLPASDRFRYARAKKDAERLCRTYTDRMAVVIVNPGEVYGPGDTELVTAGNLIDFAKANPVLVCAGGTSVCHVDDVAAGIVAALDRGKSGERYILAGENVTIRQLAELTNELLSLKKTILRFPTPAMHALAWMGRVLRVPLPFNPEMIPYATRYWMTDNSKAVRDLGVEFRDARASVRAVLEWCTETGRIPRRA